MGYQFEYLSQSRGSDGVSFGLEAARRIYGQATANRRFAGLRHPAAFARSAKSQILHVKQFAHRCRVMYLGDIDVGGADAGLFVRRLRGETRNMSVEVVTVTVACRPHDARTNLDRPLAEPETLESLS